MQRLLTYYSRIKGIKERFSELEYRIDITQSEQQKEERLGKGNKRTEPQEPVRL